MTRTSVAAATRREWAQFGVLVSIEFLTVMDTAVVNIAIPVIKDDLGYTATGVSWVVNCYLIPFAGLLLASGRLGDVVGRRRLFVAGTVLFTAASAGCGLAVEPWQLLAGRAFQGVGAALVVPAALALITDVFPEGPRRVRVLGIFASMGAIAAPIGLALGGFLAEFDWHLIFWINVPLGLIITVVAISALPKPILTPVSVDIVGAVAATGTLSLLALAGVSLEADGPAAISTVGAAAGATLISVVFVLRQRKSASPLIPPSLLRIRSIRVGNAIFMLVGTVLFSTFFFVTLYLQETRDLQPLQATLVYLPIPLAALIGTQVAPRVIGRIGPRQTLAMALVIQSIALASWGLVGDESGHLAIALVAPTTPWAFGLGLSVVSSFVICTTGVPGSVSGAASGLATTAYQGGGAVGLALVAAVAAAGTSHASAVSPDMSQAAAQLGGYHWAIWTLAGIAALAAAMTRLLPVSPVSPPNGGVPA